MRFRLQRKDGGVEMDRPRSAQDILHLKGIRRQSWMTAYDFPQAQMVAAAGIDVILVGDTLGMTMLGYPTTLPVTLDDMLYHARTVRRGAPDTALIVDLPFLTYTTVETALANGGRLIAEAGADGVKLEGGRRVAEIIQRLVAEAIPVIGHLGLTPQSVHKMGGYRVQARSADDIVTLVDDAVCLAQAGVSAIVLEGIPNRVAEHVTQKISVPTIGIGAGNQVDGQVLVFHDCMGISPAVPKFVNRFASARDHIVQGLQAYSAAVREQTFPDDSHSYHISDAEWEKFLAATET